MKLEKEITVKVNYDYDSLHNDLISKGFKIVEEYQVNDIYLLPDVINMDLLSVTEILKSCVLIRDVVGIVKKLVCKYKKYNEEKEIIEQGKVECGIESIKDTFNFMERIGYINLFEINDKCIVYSNNEIAIVVEVVNDKYLFIELEETNEHISKKYSSIEEMKNDLISIGLDLDYSSFSVRKAEIVFNEKYR